MRGLPLSVLILAALPCQVRASASKLPPGLEADFGCALQCAALTERDRAAVGALYRQAGCAGAPVGASPSPVCSSSVEQLCAGSCGGGQVDMAQWLPDAFGSGASRLFGMAQRAELQRAYTEHRQCAARCAIDGIAVSANRARDGVVQDAVERLRRCGVVQLLEAAEVQPLQRAERAIAALRSKKKAYAALLDQEQLHDGRYQVYLPFAAPFSSAPVLGASELVLAVLEGYFAGTDFGIDHVSVLTAGSPSGNQSLHPDVSYFKGLAVSVHTALQDISEDMGPTYFCPCTGEALVREAWPASAAIKMAVLKRKECLGQAHWPKHTPRGTVTIYDGAMFHKGLANGSGRERHILKLEVGASDFPVRRNYIGSAPRAAQKHAARFRRAFGPPRMGRGPTGASGARSDL